jgi:hypothetical protein
MYMTPQNDDEWTVLNPTPSQTTDMDSITHELPNVASVDTVEHTINAKPVVDEKKDTVECICDAKPKLVRKDSFESIDDDYRRPRPAGRPQNAPIPRRYTPSPGRYYPAPHYESRTLNSSTQLLEKVGKDDGIVDLPVPARGSIYFTTYPFGDKDVKKWSWLFAAGIEEEFLTEASRGVDMDGNSIPSVERVRQRHDRNLYYNSGEIDIPSVYLSRALDTEAVPDDGEHKIHYLIVIQNRFRPAGIKLLVAESKKAAGIMMYYEVLRGDSVLFVGATVHQCKKTVHPKMFRKVASLEEAVSIQDEGYVGIIC